MQFFQPFSSLKIDWLAAEMLTRRRLITTVKWHQQEKNARNSSCKGLQAGMSGIFCNSIALEILKNIISFLCFLNGIIDVFWQKNPTRKTQHKDTNAQHLQDKL